MKFEDIQGNIKLHIGCEKEYLPGWININSNPQDTDVECDATWDLSSIVFWKKESVDLIYAEDFYKDLALRNENNEAINMMLATYKHILKPNGTLIIGLENSDAVEKLSNWLKLLKFKKVIFFDVTDPADKKYLPS